MRFAVIRFMPYVQTREFANIGVILTCPKTGFFNYQIEHKYQHLSGFFKHFNSKVFKASIESFSHELDRVKLDLNYKNAAPETYRAVLDHIARPRDAIILTSEVGVTTGDNEQAELKRLFDYFVHHSFAREQKEEVLTKLIQNMVRDLQTIKPFIKSTIGDDNYSATLPLVQKNENNTVRKIIKPIYLGFNDSSEIYTKSDRWIATIKRLQGFNSIQSETDILLPYEKPVNPSESQQKALANVISDMNRAGIKTVDKNNIQKIIHFAES